VQSNLTRAILPTAYSKLPTEQGRFPADRSGAGPSVHTPAGLRRKGRYPLLSLTQIVCTMIFRIKGLQDVALNRWQKDCLLPTQNCQLFTSCQLKTANCLSHYRKHLRNRQIGQALITSSVFKMVANSSFSIAKAVKWMVSAS
jgi:hypothetical protein